MSRIGQQPITIPNGVDVTIDGGRVAVKGPKGELQQHILMNVVEVKLENGVLQVNRKSEDKPGRSAHGLTRTLINNMIEGVTKGFRKSLELQGVGYRVNKAGNDLNFSLGYSHPVVYKAPVGIAFAVEGTTKVHVDGIDKQQVGQVAAEIRDLRPPEPYKGKGVRYAGEKITLKEAKKA